MWIPIAIPSFVMAKWNADGGTKEVNRFQDFVTQNGVGTHLRLLIRIEGAVLEEHSVGDGHLPDVVEDRASPEVPKVLLC